MQAAPGRRDLGVLLRQNVPADKKGTFGYGDVWTFAAIDADTKLVPVLARGRPDIGSVTELMQDLAGRLSGLVQITTDGLKAYVSGVEDAFGADVDFAQLHKIYAAPRDGEHRYSPGGVHGVREAGGPGQTPRSGTYPRSSWSARTSPCGCRSGGLSGSPTHSRRR